VLPRFPWYREVVGISVQRQAKFWYYKRFATPWLVKVCVCVCVYVCVCVCVWVGGWVGVFA
jgi:hypothetical protein